MITTKDVTINDGESTLKFRFTKWPATVQEEFITKLIFLAANNGKEIELNKLVNDKTNALWQILCGLNYKDAKPLLDQLIYSNCSRIVTGKDGREVLQPVTKDTIDGYISDFKILLRLRWEGFLFNFLSGETPVTSILNTD